MVEFQFARSLLTQKRVQEVKDYGKNLQTLWRFIDDQTGDHELQLVLEMRWSLSSRPVGSSTRVANSRNYIKLNFDVLVAAELKK